MTDVQFDTLNEDQVPDVCKKHQTHVEASFAARQAAIADLYEDGNDATTEPTAPVTDAPYQPRQTSDPKLEAPLDNQIEDAVFTDKSAAVASALSMPAAHRPKA
jgi:hypothetical protein